MIDLSQEFHPVPKVFKVKKILKPLKQLGKKGKQWIEDRKILIEKVVKEKRIWLEGKLPRGICQDCKHLHYLAPDHRLKRSQGGSNDEKNIDWICNEIPCFCHNKRDNEGDPLGKKDRKWK